MSVPGYLTGGIRDVRPRHGRHPHQTSHVFPERPLPPGFPLLLWPELTVGNCGSRGRGAYAKTFDNLIDERGLYDFYLTPVLTTVERAASVPFERAQVVDGERL